MDYQNSLNDFFALLGDHKKMVLATSSEKRVSARMMSCIMIENAIYFQTDSNFLKAQQLKENANVALCTDNIQIEGITKRLEHPLTNKPFVSLFEKYYPSSFQMYTHLENEVLFQVIPTLITTWNYEDGKPYRLFIDCINQITKKEYYNLRDGFHIRPFFCFEVNGKKIMYLDTS